MNEPTLQELGARLRQAWQGWIYPADDDYDAAWERLDAVVNALLSRLDAQPANNERALAAALAMCGDKDRKLYLYGEHQGWCKAKEIATIISRHYVVDAQPEDGDGSRWISVKDRLPESRTWVIGCVEHPANKQHI